MPPNPADGRTDGPATVRIFSADLIQLAAGLLGAAGVGADAAESTARALVDSDLRGHYSHGVFLVLTYLEDLANGGIEPAGGPTLEYKRGAIARIDGGCGLGQLSARLGMETAIGLAQECGVGCVSVHSTGHFGAGAYWVEMAAEAGLIGFATSSEPAGLVTIPQGLRPALANLPLAWGFPGDDGHLILDMATGAAADGKLKLARLGIGKLQPGWALGGDGVPELNPDRATMIQTLAGPKGVALTLAGDALAAILAGTPGTTVRGLRGGFQPGSTCQFFQAIDVAAFTDRDEFAVNLGRQLSAIRKVPTRPGAAPARVPGERGQAMRKLQASEGILLPEPIWRALRAAARE